MKKKFEIFAMTALLIPFVTGCASITSSSSQSLAVETVNKEKVPVMAAHCKLSNDKGHWNVTTPETVTIQKSGSDLIVICEKPGHEAGTVRAISRAGAGMWGNVILGGGVGAIIDHNKGTAYNYPSVITVVMGESNVLPQPKVKRKK